jgi:hypothetical protein
MMPISASEIRGRIIEGIGTTGSPPFSGEHAMMLVILFMVFLLFGGGKYGSNRMLLFGVLLSFLNVFMSFSRSVFMLSLVGVVLIFTLQYKITTINITKQITQTFLIVLLGIGTLSVVNILGLGYVFNRLQEANETVKYEGGISIKGIITGSLYDREDAFAEGYKRYASRKSWVIGNGWGTSEDNRQAYYVDPTIKQDSAHSQIFAILFLFGWLGFIAYLGVHLRIISKSFALTGYKYQTFYGNRLFAYSSIIMLVLFLTNEIKVDSVSWQSYFGSTIILLGLAYANQNSVRYLSKHS